MAVDTVDSKDKEFVSIPISNVPKDVQEAAIDQLVQEECQAKEKMTYCSALVSFFKFLIFDVRWGYTLYHAGLIAGSIYGIITTMMIFFIDPTWPAVFSRCGTWAVSFFLMLFGSIGLSAGHHRLWSHHAYKAKLFMRLLLALMATSIAESTIYFFVKHHRAHHIYIDTHADPQNVKRGFIFSQLGWRLIKPRPEYREKAKTIEVNDALSDPVVRYQRLLFPVLAPLFAFIIPTLIPYYGWGENLVDSFMICGCAKSCAVIQIHGLLGSISHMFGERKYNRKISARDWWIMSVIAAGEGYHNYHHTFPYDYRLSEFGKTINSGKLFIDFMALFGQAYDLRTVSQDYVDKTKVKIAEEKAGIGGEKSEVSEEQDKPSPTEPQEINGNIEV